MTLTMPASGSAGLLEAVITSEGIYNGKQVFFLIDSVLTTEEERRLEAAFDAMEEAARQMVMNAEALTASLDRLHETFVAVNRRLD